MTTTQQLHLRYEAKMLGSKMESLGKGIRFLASIARVSFSQEIISSTGTSMQHIFPHIWSAKLCYRTKLGVSKSGKGSFFLTVYIAAPNKIDFCSKREHILVRHSPTSACHGSFTPTSGCGAAFQNKKPSKSYQSH